MNTTRFHQPLVLRHGDIELPAPGRWTLHRASFFGISTSRGPSRFSVSDGSLDVSQPPGQSRLVITAAQGDRQIRLSASTIGVQADAHGFSRWQLVGAMDDGTTRHAVELSLTYRGVRRRGERAWAWFTGEAIKPTATHRRRARRGQLIVLFDLLLNPPATAEPATATQHEAVCGGESVTTNARSRASVPSRRERRTDVARYRAALPQLESGVFLGDGGIGTSLVFDQGIGLPDFAAFPLLATAAGRDALDRYYDAYARIAGRDGVGVVLAAATWRANPDWGTRLSYDAAALAEANRVAVRQLVGVRRRHETSSTPVVISGTIGPRGDGYRPEHRMTVDTAIRYHSPQARAFASSEADLLTATTMTYPAEAIGIAEAARRLEMPVVLSFTLGRDGSLPSGHTLREAIESADETTDGYPAYYMINCAHPDHFAGVLETGAAWTRRIRGLRSNASRKGHTQLDRAAELDAGDPTELADLYQNLRTQHPHLVVLGGCCGTNHRHIDAISRRVRPDRRLDTPAA